MLKKTDQESKNGVEVDVGFASSNGLPELAFDSPGVKSTAVLALEKQKLGVTTATLNDCYTDPVVQCLSNNDKPQKEVACQHCPASMWFVAHTQLKCFCSRVHDFTWTTGEAIPVTICTGQMQAIAQMQADLAGG